MELHQIRYFLAVCGTLNFTRAAEQCHVSQPALTKAIKKLEEELEGKLFHREGKQVLITELGHLLHPQLETVLDRTENVREAANNFRLLKKAPLTVGILSTVGIRRLAAFIAGFQVDHPGVEFDIHEGDLSSLKSRLRAGELDLAILSAPDELDAEFRTKEIYRESYVVIFPPGHRFERMDEIKLADVSGEAYVDRLACELRELVIATCQEAGVQLYATFRSEREDWVQAMVAARLGFAFMPEYSVAQEGVLSRRLVEPVVTRNVEIVSMPGRQHSPAGAAFIEAAQSFDWYG
jgi:DNA-binding transcriptional LysR family regulator